MTSVTWARSDPKFWEGRRVTVTGGAGFFGSHVVRRLEELGAKEVFVPRSRQYDLREASAIRRMLDVAAPEVVFHVAGKVGGIGANKDAPAEFFYDNLMMGAQLLHECYFHGVAKLIIVGTACSYPKFAEVPFKEEALWDGYPDESNAPYAIAKKSLIIQSEAYRHQYGFNSINVIPVNLYGPGDNFDPATSHVAAALIRRMIEAKESGTPEVVVWGDGTPTREFLHVADAAEGLILAAERYNRSDPVNLGSGEELTIKELATIIAEAAGYKGRLTWDITKPNGQPRRKLDTDKARREFGFLSSIKLRDGIRDVIEWYRHQA